MTNSLLAPYIKLTEFLGNTLGPDYEVALHDLTNRKQSIIAIANSNISGRDIGAPLTNMALQMIKDKVYEKNNFCSNYKGVAANGKALRSSSMFIKHKGKLIGLLCINFDDSRYQIISEELMRVCHPDTFIGTSFQYDGQQVASSSNIKKISSESFPNSKNAVIAEAISNELATLNVSAARLTTDERISIISSLEKNGIFLIKGSVQKVADDLHCSSASVYRYLSKLKNIAFKSNSADISTEKDEKF
ncbi:helix-turn-helix transcriptional regulator [Sinanaerobacter sp. ZZT-01]|uniref:helix-turn-helix transcriptional regulator n=1 Tax=Sinanaerobacter sp. ZZT-01 TaxID=3111540 RepID=UPI002D79D62E|nr:PAS domain-containing protein [Sinanaerobacter sp. ZZT-01]WRR92948.1 PAS domain-containing protein [Sinanaerobacter sp. ZZT-01]